ncbi:hypothetical protein GCM10007977_001220 [Dactylosporangium sucinum]|uniref:Uncharacterized protein n=1 Tax=Dactylosporangium sucinum TaxID=1424081 RepID=A0A917WH36_9ACTN|nr:hypothetical protein GCM10007977_001220 [Dactylosporangium sucinum]
MPVSGSREPKPMSIVRKKQSPSAGTSTVSARYRCRSVRYARRFASRAMAWRRNRPARSAAKLATSAAAVRPASSAGPSGRPAEADCADDDGSADDDGGADEDGGAVGGGDGLGSVAAGSGLMRAGCESSPSHHRPPLSPMLSRAAASGGRLTTWLVTASPSRSRRSLVTVVTRRANSGSAAMCRSTAFHTAAGFFCRRTTGSTRFR